MTPEIVAEDLDNVISQLQEIKSVILSKTEFDLAKYYPVMSLVDHAMSTFEHLNLLGISSHKRSRNESMDCN